MYYLNLWQGGALLLMLRRALIGGSGVTLTLAKCLSFWGVGRGGSCHLHYSPYGPTNP